jgi:fluoride exporter
MKQVFFVGLGGAAGSILRYLTSMITLKYYSASFPLATFIVNIIGCFLAGLIFGLTTQEAPEAQNLKVLLLTGFCGGFTTFSAFALENIRLMNAGSVSMAVLYTVISIFAGLIAAWIGVALVR